jgi:molecular chaperone DnaJ
LAANKRDYYDVLGLTRDCTLTEIKREYRRLAHKYHPDVNNGNPEAEERFKEITEAYAVLSNDEKRRQYDRFGFSTSLFEDFDFSSIFSEFGFGSIFDTFLRSRTREKGSDLAAEVKISLKQAAYGVKKEIEYRVDDICELCRGRGSTAADGVVTCSQCNGTGRIRTARQTFIGNIITTSTCRVCNGTGKIIKDPCKKCRGKGHYSRKKRIKVDIPPGINDGDRLRVTGKGNSLGKDSKRGDLYITIRVIPHPGLKRDGRDILSKVEITFAQAALGCKLKAETLDGTEEIKIKPGTQPNDKIVLKSMGMVDLNGYRRGDQIVNVDVKIPKRLSRRERELLKEYAENRKEVTGS